MVGVAWRAPVDNGVEQFPNVLAGDVSNGPIAKCRLNVAVQRPFRLDIVIGTHRLLASSTCAASLKVAVNHRSDSVTLAGGLGLDLLCLRLSLLPSCLDRMPAGLCGLHACPS